MIKTSPAGGTVGSLAARRLSRIMKSRDGRPVPYARMNMERNEEREMITILRQRPELFGLCLQLIAEATERVAARLAAGHETQQSE